MFWFNLKCFGVQIIQVTYLLILYVYNFSNDPLPKWTPKVEK